MLLLRQLRIYSYWERAPALEPTKGHSRGVLPAATFCRPLQSDKLALPGATICSAAEEGPAAEAPPVEPLHTTTEAPEQDTTWPGHKLEAETQNKVPGSQTQMHTQLPKEANSPITYKGLAGGLE